MKKIIPLLILLLAFSCKNDSTLNKRSLNTGTDSLTTEKIETPITVNSDFSQEGFEEKIYYDLLIETRICNPEYSDTSAEGTPCSAKYFKFFPYNHNRKINDAFILQTKAGVNDYPYRRLLIFVREKGKLVMMNGVVGYLYQRIPQENKIDDLVVGVIDDLGNNLFDRYDVLISYKDGKYHFVEALGDLEGSFDTPELKERASEAIKKRIEEKNLIF